jgi:chromate transporter
MVAAPLVVVLGLGVAYEHFAYLPGVQRVLHGMSAVAAGLVVATALKMVRAVPRRVFPVFLAAVAFACVGVFRFPLIAVFGVLAPAATLAAWRNQW